MSNQQRGFTLMEVATVLLGLAVVATTLFPTVGTFTDKVEVTRARHDVATLGVALARYLDDVGECAVWLEAKSRGAARSGEVGPVRSPASRVDLLISEGEIPDVLPGIIDAASGRVDPAAALWGFEGLPGDFLQAGPLALGGRLDTVANILITNTPGGDLENHARYPSDFALSGIYSPGSFGSFKQAFGWRGPYLSEGPGDPWGNRYMVNTVWEGCGGWQNGTGIDNDVVVISAGPNELMETPFTSRATLAGDDDIVFVVSGSSSAITSLARRPRPGSKAR